MTDTGTQVPEELRAQAERATQLETDLAQRNEHSDLQALEIAGLRSGIDLGTTEGKAWAAVYNGDWSDADAMKTSFDGLFPNAAAPANSPPPAGDGTQPQAAPTSEFQTGMSAERQALSGTGAPPAAGAESDPYKEGFEALYDARQNGRPEQNARAEVLNRVIDAAVAGDERVLWSEMHRARWMEDTGAQYHR